MIKNILKQRRPSERARQWQVSLGRLFDIVNEFRRTKPTLLAFHLPVMCRPSNFTTELLKVPLGLLPLSLLHRISKLATGKLVPQSFHCGEIRVGYIFDICKVHKVAALGFGARDFNQCVASKLF